MKKGLLVIGMLWLLLPIVPFIYAGDGRESGSGFAMWGFLGFCALIILLQLLPAIKRLLGFAAEKTPETAEENNTTH